MDTKQVIDVASNHLRQLPGYVFDVLDVARPSSADAAVNLSMVISKLSPLVGNLIEFKTVEFLNEFDEFRNFGKWRRQDPGFPDAIFHGTVEPTPGFEIKTWFPLATEITARFKDSQNNFMQDQTYVAMLAWLPEFVIFGKPKIVDVVIVSGASVAKARDDHYHDPPDYLVLEPEDTSARTSNLQQTNTNGYKFQGTKRQFREAKSIVDGWGANGRNYKPSPRYQKTIRELIKKYRYRLDTNYAKVDRIVHAEMKDFKSRVYETTYRGMTVSEWNSLLSKGDGADIEAALAEHLGLF